MASCAGLIGSRGLITAVLSFKPPVEITHRPRFHSCVPPLSYSRTGERFLPVYNRSRCHCREKWSLGHADHLSVLRNSQAALRWTALKDDRMLQGSLHELCGGVLDQLGGRGLTTIVWSLDLDLDSRPFRSHCTTGSPASCVDLHCLQDLVYTLRR